MSKPITFLINKSVDINAFPDTLRYAEVVPVYKKDDPLDKSNYRPVRVLPCLSKLFESVVLDQINVFFLKCVIQTSFGFSKRA